MDGILPTIELMQPGGQASPLIKVAYNAATESENKIHDDAEARRLGLKGGLVPGVTLYAYLTELVVPLLGVSWLSHGTCAVRFVKPVYEGEEVSCTATRTPLSDAREDGVTLDLAVIGPDGAVCVTGTASLKTGDVRGSAGAAQPLPESVLDLSGGRRPLTAETVPIGQPLAPRTLTIDADMVEAYANEVTDQSPWYRKGPSSGLPLVPPGLLAGQPARLLRENFAYGPSIHTASEIQHLGLAAASGDYRVDATIVETFEKRGNNYLVAAVQITDHAGEPVMRIRHTSIFHFAGRG